jgi:hypothetical protein
MYLTKEYTHMEITDSFGQTATIAVPKHVKKLGISMSGGADSSMLCYLVVKYLMITDRHDVVIHPVTCNWGVRPWSIGAAKNAVKFIANHTGFKNFGQHYKFHISKEDCTTDDFKEKLFGVNTSFMFGNELIDHIFGGKTKNPPKEVMDTFYDKNFQSDRVEPTLENVYKSPVDTVPFAMVDKRFIIEQYRKEKALFDILLNKITRSCEGDEVTTENYTNTCGKCWWCEERAWAIEQTK